MMNEFVHLHLHTARGSFLDGAINIEEAAGICNRQGMKYCAVTEHGSLHSLLSFETTMEKMGIRPISGQEFYLTLDEPDTPKKHRDNFHLTVLAKNAIGYRNLKTLSSLAGLLNTHYVPRITMEWLEEYGEGLFILSGCISSYINQSILAATWDKPERGRDSGERQREMTGIALGDIEAAKAVFAQFVEMFPDSFAVEIMYHGLDMEAHVMHYLLTWAEEFDVPIVATNDAHYAKEEDADVQGTMLAILTGGGVNGKNAGLEGVPGAWIKTADEMAVTFKDTPLNTDNTRQSKYLKNSLMIAEMCDFTRPRPESLLPSFPVPEGDTVEAHLQRKLRDGVYRKYPEARGNKEHPIWNRIRYEFEVICDAGFASYFLVVSDFVQWAKKQGILVGAGRGSAAGSAVAYALDITTVDPLAYGLLFERFLNPERRAMPDIDIDFQDDKRDEVIQYVAKKYGKEYVAHIANLTTFGPKSAINDVCRIHGINYSDALAFSNLFTEVKHITDEVIESPLIHRAVVLNPQLKEVLETARKLEGKVRQTSVHASAIVISNTPLLGEVPVTGQKGNDNDGLMVLQGDMHDAEDYGLLKMDFLGLTTLTVIATAISLIDDKIDVEEIPLDDPNVYDMLGQGEVFGVFQLGESAAARVTNLLKPRSVAEIAIVSSMCRPGPVDNLETYLARKEGRESWSLLRPELEPIIGETYGFPIFQDQVMLMAQVLSGYSLGEADSLRKAMGKKLPKEMEAQRERFVSGCISKAKLDKNTAEDLFADLAKFSGYGFNKAHATSYSKISYWTAWFSYYYPEAYLAAMLTNEFNDRKKVAMIIAEARRRKIPVLPPDINFSQPYCLVEDDNSIRLGLSLVKGVGQKAAERVCANVPYSTLTDFIDRSGLNIAGIHSLIGVGACDGLEMDGSDARGIMYNYATRYSELHQKYQQRFKGQLQRVQKGGKIRKAVGDWSAPEYTRNIPPWTQAQKLTAEMEALGCFLSESPILWLSQVDSRYHSLAPYVDMEPEEVDNRNGQSFSYLLEIRDVSKTLLTKKDKRPFVRLVVGDAEGLTMDMMVFPDLYEEVSSLLSTGAFVAGFAKMNAYQGQISLVAGTMKVLPLERIEEMRNDAEVKEQRGKEGLHIIVPQERGNVEEWEEEYRGMLAEYFLRFDLMGDIPVYLYRTPEVVFRLEFGCSNANDVVNSLSPHLGARIVAGKFPAHWNGEMFEFPTIEDKIESSSAKTENIQLNPQWRASTYREVTRV